MRTLGLFLLTLGTAVGQPPAQQPPQPPTITPPAIGGPTNPTVLGKPTEYPKVWPPGSNGRPLLDWVKDMADRDPTVRETAIKVIPAFGPDAVPHVTKPLIARANDPDPGVRVNAIITLGAIGARDRKEAAPIVDALKLTITNSGPGSIVRLHATKALSNYGLLANDAIGTLLSIANDSSWETRKAVVMALGRVGQVPTTPVALKPNEPKPREADMNKWTPSEKVTAALKSMMGEDVSAAVRLEAVQSLVMLGPPDVPAELYVEKVSPLYDAVTARLKKETEKGVLIWLIMLQMRLNGVDLNEDNIRKLAGYISDPVVGVRIHAMAALGLLGDKARPALSAIAKALESPEGYVQAQAITTLAALGDTAKPMLPDLIKLQKETKDEVLKALAGEAVDILSGKKKK